MKKAFFTISILAASLFITAELNAQGLSDFFDQEEPPVEEPLSLFRGTRLGTGPSVEITPKGELHLLIQHRFGNVGNGLYDLFGLDLATMRLGFDYGITDWLSASVGRSTFFKMYDFGLKASLLKQADDGSPISLTFDGAGMVNTQRNYFPQGDSDLLSRSVISGGIIAARRFGPVTGQLSQTYLRRSYNILTGADDSWTGTGLGLKVKISKRIDLTTDYHFTLGSNSIAQANPWSIGVDLDTGGHLFQLFFSNTAGLNAFSSPNLATGTANGTEVYFGFNLVRVFYP